MHPGFVAYPPSDRISRLSFAAVIVGLSALLGGFGILAAYATDVSRIADLEVAWTFDTGG